jgi:hypothetical protein
MNNEVCELTLDELNEVSGGMDCKTGLAVSKFYGAMADCMKSVGNGGLQAYYLGMAMGALQGACD